MDNSILLGCDIGTSGTKTVAVDKNGAILAYAIENYGLITNHSQWAEQWPDVWLEAAVKTIKSVVDKIGPKNVAGLCISALYGGTGAICDEQMKPLRPALIWMDRRAEEESRWIEKNIGSDRIFQISKNRIDSYFGYTKLMWVRNHEPELWEKIRNVVPISSYIVYRLTGQLRVDYCSAGNFGGVYDYEAHNWSTDTAKLLGLDINVFPQKFAAPTDIAGGLNRDFSARTGLPEGLPICTGTVDCIASMLSAGIVEEGDNAAILGTSLNWGYVHSNVPSNPNLISMPYCINPAKMSYTYGGASTAGALPRWFMKEFMRDDSSEAYREIETAIVNEHIPAGSDGLVVLPYFMGERTPIWDENATGLIFGLSLKHTRKHVFRAILESASYSLRHIMESMESGTQVKKIIMVGGGSKSALWNQIFADVTGIPVCTTLTSVEAPLGDAFMAGIATGLIGSYKEIQNWIKFNEPIIPSNQSHEVYSQYYQIYKELYPALKDKMMNMPQQNKRSFN